MKGFSLSVYRTTGAPNAASGGVNMGIVDSELRSGYNEMTIVNDTDQDIKIKYSLSNGASQEIIVPKSIRGLTRRISCGDLTFVLQSFLVHSMHASTAAVGNITINFIG
jgi:hypothetical protein